MGEKLPICSRCGTQIPLYAQVNLVQPWKWQGLCSVLLGKLPALECPRCQNETDVPTVTAFVSSANGRMLIYIAESKNKSLATQFENYFRDSERSHLRWEITDSLADLQREITEHVLSFRPFLIELSSAQQRDDIDEFVRQNWRRLTPEVLAAGLVGVTGLVKGIGGLAVKNETGESHDLEETLKLFEGFFAEIQFSVWLRIMTNQWSAGDTFQEALNQHVREGGILGGNVENLESLVKDVERNEEGHQVSFLELYSSLAFHARAAHVQKIENPFESLWASIYVAFEMALRENSPKDGDDFLVNWRIDGRGAAATIPEREAWNAVGRFLARRIQPDSSEQQEAYDSRMANVVSHLEEVARRLGYDDLPERVLGSLGLSPGAFKEDADVVDVMRRMLESRAVSEDVDGVTAILRQFKELVLKSGLDSLEKVFDLALTKVGDSLERQAGVEAWFGECAKLLSSPQSFIDRVGEKPREWEHKLNLERRLVLWNERANAFRLLGRSDRALEITEALLAECGGGDAFKEQRYTLRLNRGILLREIGAVDAALRQLSDLLGDCALENRAGLLESYALTCDVLGRHEEGIDSLRQAMRFTAAEGPGRARLLAMLAMVCAHADRSTEALEILSRPSESRPSPQVAAVRAAAYASLLYHGVELGQDDLERLQQFVRDLHQYVEDAESRGDIHFERQVLLMLGQLAFRVNPLDSEPIWNRALALSAENDEPPDPVVLARLATLAYLRRDREGVNRLLGELPVALINRFGRIDDVWTGFGTGDAIRAVFHDLLSAAIDQGAPWSDTRLISELTRDTIGRAKLIRGRQILATDRSRLLHGITDEAVATLFNPRHPIAVLEWQDVNGKIFAVLTTIGADGNVQTQPLNASELRLFNTRSRVVHRLGAWHTGRVGDPFDFAQWRDLERWLQQEIEKRLVDGGHVVLLDHEALVGMPWHVALAPRWRCSYMPGWTTLLRESSTRSNDPLRVGVFAVPRYKDAPAIHDAFARSVQATQRWVAAQGHQCEACENESADREAFERLMADCQVVKLLCHGYASPEDREIALLVSHAGALPPLFAPGDPKLADVNRLSWRDLQTLHRAAPLVLSAACSTGLQWQAGAGEQMGLFGALRQAGTQSVIGPRWDVVAEAVVPLLDEILARHFDENASLIDALHETCLRAEAKLPRWLAWSLSLEGDWR